MTQNLNATLNELQKQFGPRLSCQQNIREQHCSTLTWLPQQLPDAVVFVKTTQEVVNVVKLSHQHQIPIIAFGAGTSLEGQINAPHGGICLDFSEMNQIKEILTDDLQVVIEPGVTREQLNSYLRDTGLFFPIDPGANATLGGMAATRASGTNAVRYRTMRDNVLQLEVVLADGQIIRTGTRAKKSAAGYDLTPLFIGSEGTLGLFTELSLKLYGLPEVMLSGICAFPTIQAACQTVTLAMQLGIDLARIELLDETSIKACNQYSKLTLAEIPTLFIEFHGTQDHVNHELQRFTEIVKQFSDSIPECASEESARRNLWRARHDAWWAIHHLFPGRKGVTTDVCVPISKLAECIALSQKDLHESNLAAATIGHVGDGNFHMLLMLDMADAAELGRAKAFIRRMHERAISMGGTCSGEHGIGQGKMDYMPLEHATSLSVMRQIKQTLDPLNILNPHKMLGNGC